jgi:superfamily I DNA/RNA helicase
MLLADFTEAIIAGKHSFDHVLVDEAQDTDPSQWRIVDELTNSEPVCIRRNLIQLVGSYAWRNINIKVISHEIIPLPLVCVLPNFSCKF